MNQLHTLNIELKEIKNSCMEIENFAFSENEIDYSFAFLPQKNQKYMLTISMKGDKTHDELKNAFFIIYELLFPIISKFEAKFAPPNARKFSTSREFQREYFQLADITYNSINETTIAEYRTLFLAPIHSLQYVVSETYKNTLILHKFTLLSHIMQGIVEEDIKYNKAVTRVLGQFIKFEKKFDCDLFSRMEITEKDFIDTIVQTRDGSSHFLEQIDRNRKEDQKKPKFNK